MGFVAPHADWPHPQIAQVKKERVKFGSLGARPALHKKKQNKEVRSKRVTDWTRAKSSREDYSTTSTGQQRLRARSRSYTHTGGRRGKVPLRSNIVRRRPPLNQTGRRAIAKVLLCLLLAVRLWTGRQPAPARVRLFSSRSMTTKERERESGALHTHKHISLAVRR